MSTRRYADPMTDYPPRHPANSGASTMAHLVYLLYAVALFTGVPMFIGVIIAYITRPPRGTLFRSHFDWAITTFWVTLILGIIGAILTWILIGWLILGILWLWTLYRIVRGWLALANARPV
jgi:uncharacterized membrane protein